MRTSAALEWKRAEGPKPFPSGAPPARRGRTAGFGRGFRAGFEPASGLVAGLLSGLVPD
jgi:hypothetical protein